MILIDTSMHQLRVFTIFLLTLFLVTVSPFILKAKWIDTKVHIVVCDVGQGDAILIYQGFFQVLIDSSRGNQVLKCLATYVPFWDHTIEVVVITHFHSDHTGGVAAVGQRYQIERIFAPLSASINSRGAGQDASQNATELPLHVPVEEPFLGQTVSTTSGLRLTFLPITALIQANQIWLPSVSPRQLDVNDTSLVTLVEYGQVTFLGVGDLEKTGESVLTSLLEFGPIDILKVGHHGAKTSSTSQFLQAITPSLAVISVGDNNSYGHPSQEALNRLDQVGAQVLRTDWIGAIELVSDGSQWWQRQK